MIYNKHVSVVNNPGNQQLLSAAILTVTGLLGFSQPALAHVEYFDLNQGAQIGDLTAAGKTASTTQYGVNPTLVSNKNGVGAAINTTSDRPLNDTSLWNATNQSYTGVGNFTGVSYNAATGAGAATVQVGDVTDWGWGGGTWGTSSHTSGTVTGLLEDTHKVDFFNFRLASAATVTISWNVSDGSSYYDNGFSLYNGVASYQAHDDGVDQLNPKAGTPPKKVQDAFDTGSVADAQGITSPFRDTLTNSIAYLGQFDALHNWGDGNTSGNWSNVAFLASAHSSLANTGGNGFSSNPLDTLETLTISLAAGNYTIAASGALGSSFGNAASFGLTGLNGVLTYNATPTAVPVPGAVWLFGSAMAGLIGLGRRKAA